MRRKIGLTFGTEDVRVQKVAQVAGFTLVLQPFRGWSIENHVVCSVL